MGNSDIDVRKVQKRIWENIPTRGYQAGKQRPLWSTCELDIPLVNDPKSTAADAMRMAIVLDDQGSRLDYNLRAAAIRWAAKAKGLDLEEYAALMKAGNLGAYDEKCSAATDDIQEALTNAENDFILALGNGKPEVVAEYEKQSQPILGQMSNDFVDFWSENASQNSLLWGSLKRIATNVVLGISLGNMKKKGRGKIDTDENRQIVVSFSKEKEELIIVTTTHLILSEKNLQGASESRGEMKLIEKRIFSKVDGIIVPSSITAEVTVTDSDEVAKKYFSAVDKEVAKEIQYVTAEEKKEIFQKNVLAAIKRENGRKGDESDAVEILYRAIQYKYMTEESMQEILQELETQDISLDMAVNRALVIAKEKIQQQYFPDGGLIGRKPEKSLKKTIDDYNQAFEKEQHDIAYAEALHLHKELEMLYTQAVGGKDDPVVKQMNALRAETKEAVENKIISSKVAAETLHKVNLEFMNCTSYLAGPKNKKFKSATTPQDWAAIRNESMKAADSPVKKWASRILMGVGVILAVGVGAALVAGVLVATGGLGAIPLVAAFVAPVVSPTIAAAAVGAVAATSTGFGIWLDRKRSKEVEACRAGVNSVQIADKNLRDKITAVVAPVPRIEELVAKVEGYGVCRNDVPVGPSRENSKSIIEPLKVEDDELLLDGSDDETENGKKPKKEEDGSGYRIDVKRKSLSSSDIDKDIKRNQEALNAVSSVTSKRPHTPFWLPEVPVPTQSGELNQAGQSVKIIKGK